MDIGGEWADFLKKNPNRRCAEYIMKYNSLKTREKVLSL
jgi:hypothetical protein